MGVGDVFGFYPYFSDDGNTYAIKLSQAVATQGGFGGEVDPRTSNIWGYGTKNVRHVWGSTGTKRTKIPIATNTYALYVSGGAFTLAGGLYTVEGSIGEKRKLNSVS
jgi:hypothetical protein